jgi:tetratricopeptide (TPR) repeat protein
MKGRWPLWMLCVGSLVVSCAPVRYTDIQRDLREQKYVLVQQELERTGPTDAQGWALLAECRYYLMDYAGQAEASRRSLSLSDEFQPLIVRFLRLSYVEQLEKAIRVLNAGNDLEAVKLLSEVVVFGKSIDKTMDPLIVKTNQRVIAFAAVASIRLKNYPQAQSYLEGLSSEWKESPELLEQLAFIYYQIGEARLCVTTCESVLARQPDNMNVLKMRAQAAEGLGERDVALQAYRDLIARTPDGQVPQRNLGTLLFHLEDWHEARMHLESAMSQFDADSLALFKMAAECAFHEKNFKSALVYYQRIAASAPWDEDAQRGIGTCLWITGKREDAKAAFLRAQRIAAADTAGQASEHPGGRAQ